LPGGHLLDSRRLPRINPRRHYCEPLPLSSPFFDLLLTLGFDQLQHPELLLGDGRERDRQCIKSDTPSATVAGSVTNRVTLLYGTSSCATVIVRGARAGPL
jgi:hypothetical protein